MDGLVISKLLTLLGNLYCMLMMSICVFRCREEGPSQGEGPESVRDPRTVDMLIPDPSINITDATLIVAM